MGMRPWEFLIGFAWGQYSYRVHEKILRGRLRDNITSKSVVDRHGPDILGKDRFDSDLGES